MEYSKADLINDAIKRLEAMDEDLKTCNDFLISAIAERRTIRHMLYLGYEKETAKS